MLLSSTLQALVQRHKRLTANSASVHKH